MKKDLYQEITDRIVAELEQGIIPWKKPWTGLRSSAISHETGRPYSILNQFMLRPGEYITFNQCKKEGGKVKKGARAQMVVFWKVYPKQVVDENGDPIKDENGQPVQKGFPVLRYYNVFHIDDCENIKPRFPEPEKVKAAEPVAEAEKIFADYIGREGIRFENVKGDKAFYRPFDDSITLPLLEQFDDASEYYSTLFHEATHSTGHPKRLNRLTVTGAAAAFGSEEYSKEELCAEIGAACILHEIGMETPQSFRNSSAYIQSWLRALQNDKKMIVGAAARADKAARLILNITD